MMIVMIIFIHHQLRHQVHHSWAQAFYSLCLPDPGEHSEIIMIVMIMMIVMVMMMKIMIIIMIAITIVICRRW